MQTFFAATSLTRVVLLHAGMPTAKSGIAATAAFAHWPIEGRADIF